MKSDLEKLSWKKWGMSVHLQRSYRALKTFPCLNISSAIELCLWKWNCLEANSLSFDMWWLCETALNYNSNHLGVWECVYVEGMCVRRQASVSIYDHLFKHGNTRASMCMRCCVCARTGWCFDWLGGGLHIHEKKTICGLMHADRRTCWIRVDTAKLTGDRCHFVKGAHTQKHTHAEWQTVLKATKTGKSTPIWLKLWHYFTR